ncbi:MAG TPA: GNAT family acetyltransferase [Sutterella sp.]|nr:GNAT family acetyltransferase [Sutterella sp.]
MSLDNIMKPASVAVIGASTREHTIGNDILKRLIAYGFQGRIYPVNPKGGTIEGLEAVTDIELLPEGVDFGLIVVNASRVLDAIDKCHAKGIRGVCVISAGFKETGSEGAALEKALAQKVRDYGMTLVGPNCLGVVNTHPTYRLDACFAESLPKRGDIGFISQSGALGGGILNILEDLGVGFAQFISVGNAADVTPEKAIAYWEKEDDVGQILLYMESIQDPKAFRENAMRTTKVKPVLALKAGRSAAGASAASSHTGSLAGADRAADALLKQCGVIREASLKDLFSSAKAFATCPLPAGKRVAIVTNSGGPAIMATDACEAKGLTMAQLSEETKAHLRSFLPAAASVKNPVDMIASAPLEHYEKTVRAVLEDEGVDMVLVIYLPFLGLKDTDVAQKLIEIRRQYADKPLAGVFMTDSAFFTGLGKLEPNLPFYMYAEDGIEAFERLVRQAAWMKREGEFEPELEVKKEVVSDIFEAVRRDARRSLTTAESIAVLDAYGVRVCRSGFAKDREALAAIGAKVGYPVVMKMSSKKTSHKTDVGGVVVGIRDEAALLAAYDALLERLKAKDALEGLEGVIIQEYIQATREFVCGIATDPQYGPLMMFGLGGVFVESLGDVVFRLAPLSCADAREMVRGIRAKKLLGNVRGFASAQVDKIEETLLRLSRLVGDFPEIAELDINPLMVANATGEPVAVDARIELKA